MTGVAQWVECHPANCKVAGSFPGQGTCLDCRPGAWLGVCKRQLIDVSLTYCYFSPSLSPSLLLSLKNKLIKSLNNFCLFLLENSELLINQTILHT